MRRVNLSVMFVFWVIIWRLRSISANRSWIMNHSFPMLRHWNILPIWIVSIFIRRFLNNWLSVHFKVSCISFVSINKESLRIFSSTFKDVLCTSKSKILFSEIVAQWNIIFRLCFRKWLNIFKIVVTLTIKRAFNMPGWRVNIWAWYCRKLSQRRIISLKLRSGYDWQGRITWISLKSLYLRVTIAFENISLFISERINDQITLLLLNVSFSLFISFLN